MNGRTDPERTAQGSRAAILARLTQDERLDEGDAERWVTAWERHATTEGLDPSEGGHWDAAWEWITDQIAPKRDMSAEADDGEVYGG